VDVSFAEMYKAGALKP